MDNCHYCCRSYFYWSTEQRLLRAILSGVQTTSESCPTALSESPRALASLTAIRTFTIEHGDDDIYYLGEFNCTTGSPSGPVPAVISISLEGNGDSSYLFTSGSSQILESYTQTVMLDFLTRVAFLPTGTASQCPGQVQSGSTSDSFGTPVNLMRMYRSTKQPLPGMAVGVGKVYVLLLKFLVLPTSC